MRTENKPYGKSEPYSFNLANAWLKEPNVTDIEVIKLQSGETLMRRVGNVPVVKLGVFKRFRKTNGK